MVKQLKSRQVCLFIIAFFPVTKIFMMPSILASFANEDLWISAVISLLFDFITLSVIVYVCRKAKTSFFTLLENSLGKTGAKIILGVFFVYFMLKCLLPLSEQKDYVELTLYTLMPSKLYFLPMFAVAFYLCCKKLRILGRASDVLWAVSLIGLLLLFALSLPNADFGAILPVGANGIDKIFRASYASSNWFGDAVYILFLIGEFEYKKKDGFKILISFLIYALLIVLFMIIFYSIFTSIAFRQRFALTEISKYTAVINNIGRFDYMGIMLILFSSVFALSLPMYFSSRILTFICEFKVKWIAPLITVAIQLLVLVIFYQYYASIEKFITHYASVFFIFVGNVLPLFTAFLVKKEVQYASNA